MGYDATQGRVLLFGGIISGSQVSDETWSWDGFSWTRLNVNVRPRARTGHAMASNASGRIVLFGGRSSPTNRRSVLNDTFDIARAVQNQAVFFEDESCGQCAPCRIGARMLRRSLDRYLDTGDASALEHTEDVAWEMVEGSICGLGYSAPLPLKTALEHFPEAFAQRGTQ